MADTQTFNQKSFSTENDQVDGYRRLSQLAVWSIPLGLASALAMVSPLLWFVPVVAVAFALGGLWVISRSNDTTGRRLALIGLGLATLFGTWGMAWTVSRRTVIYGQAREHASEWFALMQKQQYLEAHQLSLDYFERLPAGSSLESHYEEREVEEIVTPEQAMEMTPGMEQSPFLDLQEFKAHGISQRLVEANGDFEFKFVKNLSLIREGQFATVVNQVFRLTFADDHEPRELDVKIELKRTIDIRKAYWQVGSMSNVNEPSAPRATPG